MANFRLTLAVASQLVCLATSFNFRVGTRPLRHFTTPRMGDDVVEETAAEESSTNQPSSPAQPVSTPAQPAQGSPCVIKVIGVGGGGGNAVNSMVQSNIPGVTFWSINTDAQALVRNTAENTLNIGNTVTRGLGAGGDPEMGRLAAEESRDEIARIVDGADMVFVTAGMGGGTGSGAAPVVAEIAKDLGALTVGVVTKPFMFEGGRRMKQAKDSIAKLEANVDTLIVVANDRLLQIVPPETPLQDAFVVADDILRMGVVGISEIIVRPGLINVDFADVKSVMTDSGTALMGIGSGQGRDRARNAAIEAISSPLLEYPVRKAKGIVFNVVGGSDLSLSEINAASEVIYEAVDPEANIIFGATVEPSMKAEVSICVLATGFEKGEDPEAQARTVKARELD